MLAKAGSYIYVYTYRYIYTHIHIHTRVHTLGLIEVLPGHRHELDVGEAVADELVEVRHLPVFARRARHDDLHRALNTCLGYE